MRFGSRLCRLGMAFLHSRDPPHPSAHHNRCLSRRCMLFLMPALLSHKSHKHCRIVNPRIGCQLRRRRHLFLQPAMSSLSCTTDIWFLSIGLGPGCILPDWRSFHCSLLSRSCRTSFHLPMASVELSLSIRRMFLPPRTGRIRCSCMSLRLKHQGDH